MVLYSSISSISYVFTGKLGSAVVFTATGTFPAPEGNFLTQSNPYSSAWIDRLEITLSNPALPECQAGCSNPIGYRSISVSTSAVTSGVPEPEALALSAIGLLTVMARRKKVRPRICS